MRIAKNIEKYWYLWKSNHRLIAKGISTILYTFWGPNGPTPVHVMAVVHPAGVETRQRTTAFGTTMFDQSKVQKDVGGEKSVENTENPSKATSQLTAQFRKTCWTFF